MSSMEIIGAEATSTDVASKIVQIAYNTLNEMFRKAAGSDPVKIGWVNDFFKTMFSKGVIGSVLQSVLQSMRLENKSGLDIEYMATKSLGSLFERMPWSAPAGDSSLPDHPKTKAMNFILSLHANFQGQIASIKNQIVSEFKGYGAKQITTAEVSAAPAVTLAEFTGGAPAASGKFGIAAVLAAIAAFFFMNK